MDKQLQDLQSKLEAAVQRADTEGVEFWFARDLQSPLGYARWENSQTAIQRVMESCEAADHAVSDHFRGVTKMVELGSGSKRKIDDCMLPRSFNFVQAKAAQECVRQGGGICKLCE